MSSHDELATERIRADERKRFADALLSEAGTNRVFTAITGEVRTWPEGQYLHFGKRLALTRAVIKASIRLAQDAGHE